jgi:hypothetical protein
MTGEQSGALAFFYASFPGIAGIAKKVVLILSRL